MTRRVLAPAFALLFSVSAGSPVFAQATPAAPVQTPPATPAKWIPPVKGLATIEVIRGSARRVGDEMETLLKIKNTSKGAIALLGIDEYWYDKNSKLVSGSGTQKIKKLLNPGDVVEFTSRSPWKPDLHINQFAFNHAHGKIEPKAVKKFIDDGK